MLRRGIVEWDVRGDLAQVAALWGEAAPDVRGDLAGLPAEAVPVAVVADGDGPAARRMVAIALFLPASLLGHRCALARLAIASERDADAAMLLVDWAETRAAAEQARKLEVAERRAPGVADRLESRGYRCDDALVRMRRAHARPVPPLPGGFVERSIHEAGVDAWVAVANESFAGVAFSAPATRDEYARQLADPRFDASLVRIVLDEAGPAAFLHGTVSLDGLAEVRSIGVAPRAQGRGLGRWVLRRCEELLDARSPREVILRVADSNHRARDLYACEGYAEVSRQRVWSRAP